MKTKKSTKENCNCGTQSGTDSSKSHGKRSKSSNHLITEYFPTVTRSRRRLTAKDLAVERERLIVYYLSSNCDPDDYLGVQEIAGKGKGITSLKHISKGDFICEYAGDLINMSEAKKREKLYELTGAGCYMYYFTWGKSQLCVDATKPTNRLGRLINHSRKYPNCKTQLFVHSNKPHLIFIALRDIQPKEEILYDYGENDRMALKAHPWLSTT